MGSFSVFFQLILPLPNACVQGRKKNPLSGTRYLPAFFFSPADPWCVGQEKNLGTAGLGLECSISY